MTPHQHILRCKEKGTGCHLSVHEVRELMMDDAIAHRAHIDDVMEETGLDENDIQGSLLYERTTKQHGPAANLGPVG